MHKRTEWALEAAKKHFERRDMIEKITIGFCAFIVGFFIGYTILW